MTAVADRPVAASRPTSPRRSRPDRGPRRRSVVAELALVGVLPAIAASALRPIYDGWGFVVRTGAVAATVAVVTVWCLRLGVLTALRWVALAVSGVVVVSYASLAATMPSGLPTGATISALRESVSSGWSTTLDAVLPVPGGGITTCLVLLMTFVASWAGVELALRSRRVLAPVLPSLVVFALTMPLTAATRDSTLGPTTVYVISLLVFVLVRSSPELAMARNEDDDPDDRQAAPAVLSSRMRAGLPLAVVCSVIGSVVIAAMADPDRYDPFDPRDLRSESVDLSRAVNPIFEVRSNVLLDPPRPVVEFALADPAEAGLVDRVAIIALEEYDGALWSSAGTFGQAASGSDAGYGISVPVVEVEHSVTLVDLASPWLPTARNPIEVSSGDVLFAESEGVIVRDDDFALDTYDVVSLVPTITDAEMGAFAATVTGDLTRLTQLPTGVAVEFGGLAQDLMGSGAVIERLRRLEAALREIPYDPQADGGHSVGRLREFLYEDRFGLAEQHAAAFALLARTQGLPTRLVVGLRTLAFDDEGIATPLTTISTAQYHVWAEVRFDQVGWVPFDPTPAVPTSLGTGGGVAPTPSGQLIGQGPTPQPNEPIESDFVEEEVGAGRGRAFTGAVASLLLAVLVGLYVLVVVGLKRYRRARRHFRGTPIQRVVGAWTEATDRLLEVGVRAVPAMTVDEITAAARARSVASDRSGLDELAPSVRRAIYSLHEPSTADIDQAWEHADRFAGEVRAGSSLRRRVRAKLDPRPLLVRR